MRKSKADELWAVYEVVQGKQAGMKVMCPQSQWEALALSHPGANALIRDGITSESEAEKLARGTSGDAKPRAGKRLTAPAAGHACVLPTGHLDLLQQSLGGLFCFRTNRQPLRTQGGWARQVIFCVTPRAPDVARLFVA